MVPAALSQVLGRREAGMDHEAGEVLRESGEGDLNPDERPHRLHLIYIELMLYNGKRPIKYLVHHFSDIHPLFSLILPSNHFLKHFVRDSCI